MRTFLARHLGRAHGAPADFALVPLRVLAGVALAHHGWGKINNPFHWMGSGDDAFPAWLQSLAALSEFGGGIALAAGLVTPLACFGIGCTMAVAVSRHLGKGGTLTGPGGWELAGVYLCVAVLFGLGGPGRFSLDALVLRRVFTRALGTPAS